MSFSVALAKISTGKVVFAFIKLNLIFLLCRLPVTVRS